MGKVTLDQCREIAKIKAEDLNAYDTEEGNKYGTARSMGIEVIGGNMKVKVKTIRWQKLTCGKDKVDSTKFYELEEGIVY